MLFTPNMKLADMVASNHSLVLILQRFNIQLGFGEKSIRELFANELIGPGGLIVWEHAASVSLPGIEGVGVRWERSYGDVTVTMLEKVGA